MIDRTSPETETVPLPCPVCGSTNIGTFKRQEGLYVVCCEDDDCIFHVEVCDGTIVEAINRWNTRKSDLAPTPDQSALRAAAERVCWFDWSGNDTDACAAIDALRKALGPNSSTDRQAPMTSKEQWCAANGISHDDPTVADSSPVREGE